MKKIAILSFVCILSGLLLIACQRDQGVQAGNDRTGTGTYQPRPARVPKTQTPDNQNISGELLSVDMAKKRITVRVSNGMEQTFEFDNNTMVMGLEGQPQANAPKAGKTTNAAIRSLAGKEGSEVTVQWRDDNGAKMATHVNVTQVNAARNTRKGKAKGTY